MAIEVKIPPMGESISSGILAKWHVENGAIVKKDQVLFELETDKITSEGTAEAAGKITFSVEAGTEVKIGQVVATIDSSAAAEAPAAKAAPAAESKSAAPAAEPAAKHEAQSPAVRRLAAETGIDPTSVSGSGKAGRVTKGDMLSAADGKPAAPAATEEKPAVAAPAVAAIPAPAARGERRTRVKMTKLRQTIANRLVQAQHQAAMLTTFNEADMSVIMALRAKYQDEFTKKNGVKLGFMSFFVKAVVNALKEVPGINAQIDGDHVIQNHYFDIGVAVSTEKGLIVPVIRDCDQKSMAEIEKDIAAVAKKARDGKLTLPDLEGGVFTITNGGLFGSMLSTPILNAPQRAILGMHAIKER
ncbi:MAG: 2-oxoglutarate dehydrogenase complex dihydrolipoyllysine-residue succinyltransferase, partial [Candidatus Didemnitutus sp.]|nr:2-oxoglutarate dehydrogenase complex dihydrolipoyllysine-residue succinyltransferase [Candidatus Didemnitutus sp.]